MPVHANGGTLRYTHLAASGRDVKALERSKAITYHRTPLHASGNHTLRLLSTQFLHAGTSSIEATTHAD